MGRIKGGFRRSLTPRRQQGFKFLPSCCTSSRKTILNIFLCLSAFNSCVPGCVCNQNSVRKEEECQRSVFAHADLQQHRRGALREACSCPTTSLEGCVLDEHHLSRCLSLPSGSRSATRCYCTGVLFPSWLISLILWLGMKAFASLLLGVCRKTTQGSHLLQRVSASCSRKPLPHASSSTALSCCRSVSPPKAPQSVSSSRLLNKDRLLAEHRTQAARAAPRY